MRRFLPVLLFTVLALPAFGQNLTIDQLSSASTLSGN